MNEVLDFFTILYEDGLSYSAINSARSALSAFGLIFDGKSIGTHPVTIRFMKGVYNLRPPTPKYVTTWNVSLVLDKLRSLSPVKFISLKNLTLKLAMLLCLVLAGRTQNIHLSSIKNMIAGKTSYTLQYSENLKQSRPGRNNPVAEFKAYPADRRICCVTVLKEYLHRTSRLRKDNDSLFISYVNPHGPVSRSTISRWLKTLMLTAGIDINKYTVHSIRSASVSKAKLCCVPIESILKTAGWSTEKTFARYYDKFIENTEFDYQKSVLS